MFQISYSSQNGLKYDRSVKKQMTEEEKQIFEYACVAYSFVIYNQGWKTYREFAEEIRKYYDESVPENKRVCEVLEKYSV